MSYGVKFKLDFADNLGNPRRLEILKKDYSGSTYSLVGTASPVVLKWDSDDDIYTPIIGSTCELNLFVTDDTNYDDWYEADEREYKVRISTGDVSGGQVWNLIEDTYAAANFDWDNAGEDLGLEIYWEGFLIVDRFTEAVTTKPFPIKLVASDGLGTLSGFDAPYSNVILDSSDDPDPTASQTNFDNLFYYVRKILENTNLDFDIYIANNIRKSNGAANETLLHDIDVYEFGLLKDNFQRYDAKELLERILKVTNSRVFQSNGRWYIISNSNIMDVRLFVSEPTVEDLEFTVFENSTNNEFALIGTDPQNLSLTFSTVTGVSNGTSSIAGNIFTYTPTADYFGQDFFTYKANNGTLNSNTARVDITVLAEIDTAPTTTVRSISFNFLWKGDSIQEALSNCRGWTNTYPRTHASEFSSAYPLASSGNMRIVIGASATDAQDETSFRYMGIGAKHVVFDEAGYFATAQVGDPFPPTIDQLSNSYVYQLTDGYYAMSQRSLLTSTTLAYDREQFGISKKYAISELTDSPLKDVLTNSIGAENAAYIKIFRIVNGEIVEFYPFVR